MPNPGPTIFGGNFYYFLRVPGPSVAGVDLGHIGWGFETALEYRSCTPSNLPAIPTGGAVMTGPMHTSQWMFGSMENGGGWPVVAPGFDIDYWTKIVDTEAQMLAEMSSMLEASRIVDRNLQPYTYYKKVPVQTAHALAAEHKATNWWGYGVIGNNCLDNTAKVAEAYGTPVRNGARLWQISPINFFEHTLGDYPSIPLSTECAAA